MLPIAEDQGRRKEPGNTHQSKIFAHIAQLEDVELLKEFSRWGFGNPPSRDQL